MLKRAVLPLVAWVWLLAPAQADTGWSYNSRRDAMTDVREVYAQIESINSIRLAFPYEGRNHGNLFVLEHPHHGRNVIFTVDKGQILCRRGDCAVTVRFDKGAAQIFRANPSPDGSSKVVFLQEREQFIAAASKAKSILLQATMYQAGGQLFEFRTNFALKWPLPK
jgi:hypothetical protein